MNGSESAIAQFWPLVSRVLQLDGTVFFALQTIPLTLTIGLAIVFIGGLSQAISQGIVLFINRVPPLRSLLTLLIAGIMFAFNFLFWFVSTWWVAQRTLGEPLALTDVFRTLGWSYAPMMFGILSVLPYFGMPIFFILSTWTLLAIIIGMTAVTPLGYWQAFQCCFWGWLILQVFQRTIGRPIQQLTLKLANRVAGGDLLLTPEELQQQLYSGLEASDSSHLKP
ncbi:MAG: hypothetical protein AB4290_00315 [Spirulina sp.]